ncbi:MAG: CinA family nicotinamide mononucleotide deamidase-related protein [Anaerolineales bacterium]|nr:CinA family nicotinamide mononucleotide deamidase-related protein [Anaerolineales bacterium]MCS7246909.1 CinA family nicotinamide mononucleotide deamidase-related protein [Anaerolineales bacterium]MDW8160720.1 CinA family nicotinamide mononucleotide deamidase-related protein [Anaerolineales bacterium]MDW8447824.1 CinA family nicotinamide mononucleotide deamidase-related protein [Anaerolineales bacterium]
MTSAEILTIGTEILLGEIVDTNAPYLARQLRTIGLDVYRKTTVGDNAQRIAAYIREAFTRCQVILSTGGLGPTVDDPTREAVALAFDVELEYHPALWEQIQERFRRYGRTPTENNRRQAFLPSGAIPLENPVGTAPAFIVDRDDRIMICLPGVPREMEHLMETKVTPYLRERLQLHETIKTRILHTIGVGESLIDSKIADLETSLNPTVGLAAHAGQVDIRIAAKATSEAEAERLIQQMEQEIRNRLGNWIYGADEETIETIALQPLKDKNWRLSLCESGTNGMLLQRLSPYGAPFVAAQFLPHPYPPEAFFALTEAFRQFSGAECGLGVLILPKTSAQEVYIHLITPETQQTFTKPYGGPPQNAPRWAIHHCLDILRNL